MSNKRRHAQAIPLTAILIGVAIAICLAAVSIKVLTVKYQVLKGGEKLKDLERELASVTVKNEALQTDKDRLISPPNLAKALEKGYIKLVKIDEKYVVPVGRQTRAVAAVASGPEEGGR